MRGRSNALWGIATAATMSVGCGDATRTEMTTAGDAGIGDSGPVDPEPEPDPIDPDDGGDEGGQPGCVGDGTCDMVDLLFIVDNSGTMGEEQLNLAANFPLLVDRLRNLTDRDGNPVSPDVNIMVTTSDFGHPLCSGFQKDDYAPAQGEPISTGCNERLARFTGLDPDDPAVIEDACTQNCPVDIVADGPFIHFNALTSNVPGDDVAGALSCLGPQGIDGCGYEAPLESMLQAINPESCWNRPGQDKCAGTQWENQDFGFLRPGALLAVAVITDEADCSVASPDGYSFFTDSDKNFFWSQTPGGFRQPTSAVCWNAGVICEDANDDGIYEFCQSKPNDVLHPVERYTALLDYMRKEKGKEVVMLGVLGVPPVTERNPDPPFEPLAGGIHELVYRDWIDGIWDGTPTGGDILPLDWAQGINADDKRFEFGAVGPGCTGSDNLGNFTGQAIPPVRIREVCESLNVEDDPDTAEDETRVRCCIESICSTDFSPALDCLSDIIQEAIDPIG